MNIISKVILVLSVVSMVSTAFGQQKGSKQDSTTVTVTSLDFNCKEADFSAVPFRSGIVFCSRRKGKELVTYQGNSGEFLSHIFYTEPKTKEKWQPVRLFSDQLYALSNQGPVSFTADENTIFFTGTCMKEPGKCNTRKASTLKIYTADFSNGKWQNISPLPFNSDKYSSGHPAISANGKMLIFASDKPGGYGGTDLYASTFRNGSWSKPQNLGRKVNSKKNEMFPFINKDGWLYFSSDGHQSLGKMDIYSSKFLDSTWQNVRNLGKPFNSAEDDFAFYEEENGYRGYFTSDRDGNDDIFRFERAMPPCDTIGPTPYCYTFNEKGMLDGMNLPVFYVWDLGDGNVSQGKNVTHCFSEPGNYHVQLNIIDSVTGDLYFREASYNMDIKPVERVHISQSGFASPGKKINFSAKKSDFSDCLINEYHWNFGDGYTAKGEQVSHTFKKPGKYQVNLLVKGHSVSNGTNCMSCGFKTLEVGEETRLVLKDSTEVMQEKSTTIFDAKKEKDLVYKVQVKTSEAPIPIDSLNFRGLENVEEYKDNEMYGYVVGKEQELENAYPLYTNIKEMGYDKAKVVAFKDGRIMSGKDTTIFKKSPGTVSFTTITGRLINRYGEPLKAHIILENLTTGKIITKIMSDSAQGKFHIILPNDELYGFYAELNGYYSVSNFIDLRNENRNLEIKKNIEMIALRELNEENIPIRINNIFFAPNQYRLKRESFPELVRISALVTKDESLKIEVSGHTDNTGDPASNLLLSKKRAESVKNFLISQGLEAERIIALGFGDKKPLVSNSTERGRYLNRRVEFRLFYD